MGRDRKSLVPHRLNLRSSFGGNDKSFAGAFKIFPFLPNPLGFFAIDKAVFVKPFRDGVQQVTELPAVLPRAIERAQRLAHLGKNRTNFKWMKEHIYGEHAAINGVHGPAYMLRHPDQYAHRP